MEAAIGLFDGLIQFEPMYGIAQVFLWETSGDEPRQVAIWYANDADLRRLITDAQIALARLVEIRRRADQKP